MPSISSCPECHRDLTIPDMDDRGRSLRCPLCDAQFSAERILADSVRFPPLALVVGEDAAPTGAAELAPEYGSPVTMPGLEAITPLAHTQPSPDKSDTSLSQSLADGPVRQSETADSAHSVLDDDGEMEVDVEDEELPAFATQDDVLSRSERRPSDSEVAVGNVAVDTGASAPVEFASGAVRVSPQSRRRASPWGAMGQLIGMAVGGALGLAIGYWILLWINPQADFLKLRGKLPAWMMPSGRQQRMQTEDFSTATPAVRPQGSLADLLAKPEAASLENDEPVNAVDAADFEQGPVDESAAALQVTAGAPAPQPPPADTGPRGFTPHSAAELRAALDAAAGALRCEYCRGKQRARPVEDGSPPDASDEPVGDKPSHRVPRCEHCRGTGVGNITVPVFERLCQLADTATFAQLDDTDEAAREQYRGAAQDLLLLVGADRDRGEVIGRLAADRLDDSQRPSNGIILCGSVAQARYRGDLFTMRIVLSGIAHTVTVVSRDAPYPPFGPRDHVLVLGSIVDSPKNNLAGYEGDEPQVIWGGVPFKLSGP